MSDDDDRDDNATALRDMSIDLAVYDLGDKADEEAVVARAIVQLSSASIALSKAAGVEWDGYRDRLEVLWCLVSNEPRTPPGELN